MEETALARVIREGVPAEDRNIVTLEAYRFMGMAGDAGRPSDAARAIVREYQRDPAQFRLDFAADRKGR